MTFHLMRLSLSANEERDLFRREEEREQYIRRIFGTRTRFSYRGREIDYVPDQELEGLILGWFAKPRTEIILYSPDTKFSPKEIENCKLARVAVDPAGDPKGQKAAVEDNPDVGLPLSLMRKFAETLNDGMPPPAWTIFVGAIAEDKDFWISIEPYENRLSELRFILPVPNILRMEDSLQKDLEEIRDEEHAQEVAIALKSKNRPLRARTKRVEALVKRADAGAGRAIAMAGRKKSTTRMKGLRESLLTDMKVLL